MPNIYVVREHIPAAEIRRPQPSVEVPPEPPWRPDGWLSIRETIDTAAKALFRGEWTGNEVYARALPPLSGKTEDDLEKCQQHRRGRFNLLNHPVDGRGETDPATIEEYAAECAAARRHFETITWLRQRWWSGDIPVSRLDGKMHPVLQHQFADGNFFHWVVRHASNPSGVGGHLLVWASDLAKALESATLAAADVTENHPTTKTQSLISAQAAPEPIPEVPAAATDDDALRQWAISYLNDHKNDAKHPLESEIVRAAKDHFKPAIIKKLRDKLRAIPKPPEWNQKGRTPRQRHSA